MTLGEIADLRDFIDEIADKEKIFDAIKETFPNFEEIANQMGYENLLEDNQEMAYFLEEVKSVYEFGVMNGTHGFIYYSEIKEFFEGNMEYILDYWQECADNYGETFDEYVTKTTKSLTGGNSIADLLRGGNEMINALVYGYVEGFAYTVMDNIEAEEIQKDNLETEEDENPKARI